MPGFTTHYLFGVDACRLLHFMIWCRSFALNKISNVNLIFKNPANCELNAYR